ncbi:TPA: hypothetical protein QC443_002554 [Bacillus cereus]|uniref:hypothetical protein n=1 Tax=Bacillus cereus TaxID=1396 RepID=UPI0019274891|nr:hypothetical protein [Bacillus cereus]MBL3768698.1 hypothetical protein [Bacillus cereus]MBL3881149.1 hypothetical protein [Bacillus cereus]HDR7980277.1 hypothetical protein [Bacillus cereus]HDR8076505.1 hypothetical protein [Bacillus cereus]HDR8514854.1 hypothetical protein [Bacillus cereus]
MPDFIKSLPEWKSRGIEPPQSLRDTGFKIAQRPPASYFDWFFNRTYEALKELQENAIGSKSLGDLSQLTTKEKITLVGAINEINEILKINQSPHRDAINVKVIDEDNYFTGDNVERVLQEVGTKVKTADTAITELKNKQTTQEQLNLKIEKHLESLSIYKSSKDENGIYKIVEWKTKGGILRRKSVLSDPNANGNYLTQTITTYADDGTTVTETQVSKPTYDADGDVVSEVLQ